MAIRRRVGQIRIENIKRLLTENWDGRQSRMESELGLGKGVVSKWFQRNNVPEYRARAIERELGLESGVLDLEEGRPDNVYYVMVSVKANRVREFVEFLQPIQAIKEVSALFGEMDVFIKIVCTEAEYQELVLRRMQRDPSIRFTKTYQVLEGMHWQREQGEVNLAAVAKRTSEDLVSRVIQHKTDAIYHEIRRLDESRVSLSRSGGMVVHPKEMLEHAKMSVYWTSRVAKERYVNDKELFTTIKEFVRVKHGRVRQILLLDDGAENLRDQINRSISCASEHGIDVRLLDESSWCRSKFNASPEGYFIVDEELVLIQKKREDFLWFASEDLKEYVRNFENNWQQSSTVDEYFVRI